MICEIQRYHGLTITQNVLSTSNPSDSEINVTSAVVMVAGHVSPFSILALLLHTFCFVNRSMRHSNNLHFGFCFNLNVDKVSVKTYDA